MNASEIRQAIEEKEAEITRLENKLIEANYRLTEMYELENDIHLESDDESETMGNYGRMKTYMSTLAAGTKFYVYNGHWDGEIVEINGTKYISIGGENSINLSEYPNYTLEIKIK